ncbi:MAG: carbohydrate porin, partial [Prochloron sp. SP5CPC1]|nr:carbohydrate porin [Candidatus Paraprochloron terpiosi SP5CPC1]
MSKILWSILLTSPMALMASATVAIAQEVQTPTEPAQRTVLEKLEQYSREGNSRSLGQVNSVDQLRDVEPGHWAYQALKNLIDNYGCMRGFPDRTFRGNQGVTRYEFAATLNECLQRIEEFIVRTSSRDESQISRRDRRQIQRLVSEFEAELAILGARVDDIEGRVDFLEDHQFSTTTKLEGEVVFAISDAFGGPDGGTDNTVFQDRVRLAFVSSFTGKDALYT